ncbi:MAG: ABC transporter ATP-binding protein [Candidatus Goldbacteria bacterium]|nr:ABC transporter ATP-binding protein [Candidatus Goldiibacteriota bacterium]
METVIETNNLTKIYKPLDFWKRETSVGIMDVNLSVHKGEIFGLLGLNGAGKTTLMKTLLGLLQPTSGRIKILGGSINDVKIRHHIGYMPELPYFPKYLKAYEIMEYFADIFGIKNKKSKILEILDLVGLKGSENKKIKGFSKGMQSRLGMAQALINDPDVLFLDEPMSGLDPLGYKEMRDILLNLNKQGKTIFFNSHILSEVERICDKVAIMHKGKISDIKNVKQVIRKYKSMESYFIHYVKE